MNRVIRSSSVTILQLCLYLLAWRLGLSRWRSLAMPFDVNMDSGPLNGQTLSGQTLSGQTLSGRTLSEDF
jgi:hypothetical protein